MRAFLIYLSLLLGAALIFLLSWLPNPRISTYGFFPALLGQWVDAGANVNIRTAVPFVLLGLLSSVYLGITRQHWSHWVGLTLGFVSVVFVAELGQLHLPQRHFDWCDITWGTLGALAGMTTGGIMAKLLILLRLIRPTS